MTIVRYWVILNSVIDLVYNDTKQSRGTDTQQGGLMKMLGLILISVLSLYGCTGMADFGAVFADMGVVRSRVDTFDGATVITVSPNNTDSPGAWTYSIGVGGRWTSNAPHLVAVVLEYSSSSAGSNSYTNISGMDVMIDGEKFEYRANGPTDHSNSGYNTVTKMIYTESENRVVVPLDIIKQMISANDCRLRIYTSDGYQDSIFSVDRLAGGAPSARMSFRDFVAKIEETKLNLGLN